MKKPLLSEMTLREKIGQMLLPHQHDIYCRESGDERDAFCERTDFSDLKSETELAAYLEKENFGAFLIDETAVFKAMHPDAHDAKSDRLNAETYRNFIKKQSAYGKIPALTAGDFSFYGVGPFFQGMTSVPAPLALGAANSLEPAYALGACVAKEMRFVGANWLFGPSVDICHRFNSNIMNTAVPDDASRLAELTRAYVKGVQDGGVAVAIKHFPGGDRYDYRDPDVSPTVISSTMEEWWEEQGMILKEMIRGGAYSVMVNHAAFPVVDDAVLEGSFCPASVSKRIVTDLLKGELGFDGVVVTESIASPALITCFASLDEMLIALVNAGNDMITGAFPDAGDIIERAVVGGAIPEARIDDACERILRMKAKLGLFAETSDPVWDACEITEETKAVSREIADKAVTLVLDSQKLLPVIASNIKTATIVYFSHSDKILPQMEHMKAEIEKRGVSVKLQHRVDEPLDMERVDAESDLILYVVYVAPGFPKGHPGIYGAECAGCQFTFSQGQKKSIGISMGYPYIHYDLLGNAETFINTYGYTNELIESCVKVIFGEMAADGVSPVKLDPDQIWY